LDEQYPNARKRKSNYSFSIYETQKVKIGSVIITLAFKNTLISEHLNLEKFKIKLLNKINAYPT